MSPLAAIVHDIDFHGIHAWYSGDLCFIGLNRIQKKAYAIHKE